MRPVFVVTFFLATLVVLVPRVNSSETHVRRKRTSENVITGETFRFWDKIRRLKAVNDLVNETHSKVTKDCKVCFDAETKENCVCDASDIIQHMTDAKYKIGKERHQMIEKLPEELARTVKKILWREASGYYKRKQNLKKKLRLTKKKVQRVLLFLIRKTRAQEERRRHRYALVTW